jgi:hypothetical protein
MATPTLEDVREQLQPVLQTGESLEHWAFGQTKPKPSVWVLLLLPVVLIAGIALAIFGAQVAIAIGVIKPGPMMPVVAIPLSLLVLGPYMYLLLKGVVRCAVGLTDRRLLVVDFATGPDAKPTKGIPISDSSSLTGRAGLIPQLTVRQDDAVLNIAFPLNVRGNKEQAVAIAQRFAAR